MSFGRLSNTRTSVNCTGGVSTIRQIGPYIGPFSSFFDSLVVLGAGDPNGPISRLLYFLDWLPARILLLTFGAIGNFESIRPLFMSKVLDADIQTNELLMQGFELASPVTEAALDQQIERVRELLKRALAVWVVVASVLVIVS